MPLCLVAETDAEGTRRERCYRCFRPRPDCFCAVVPVIDNKTEVLIVQHVRERFHPFNTARIVQKSLSNSRLLVDQTDRLAASLTLKPRAGLLYPGPSAVLLEDVPPEEHPDQLVVLDGTWHHAKSLFRDIPALQELPRYRLAPATPSRYRIRREPSFESLSTVEAVVAALKTLEPETVGLDRLLAAFDTMIDRQLAHPKVASGDRRHAPLRRTFRNIPVPLLGDLSNVVAAYGESVPRERRGEHGPRLPVFWTAQRLGAGANFACAIRPPSPLPKNVLQHLELTEEDFANAMSPGDARDSWAAFVRPGDIVAVYQQSTARLLTQLGDDRSHCIVLKSVDFNPRRRYGLLEDLLDAEKIEVGRPSRPGRAARRLANVVAFIRFLHVLGNAETRS